jgi:hypothetical protein
MEITIKETGKLNEWYLIITEKDRIPFVQLMTGHQLVKLCRIWFTMSEWDQEQKEKKERRAAA